MFEIVYQLTLERKLKKLNLNVDAMRRQFTLHLQKSALCTSPHSVRLSFGKKL